MLPPRARWFGWSLLGTLSSSFSSRGRACLCVPPALFVATFGAWLWPPLEHSLPMQHSSALQFPHLGVGLSWASLALSFLVLWPMRSGFHAREQVGLVRRPFMPCPCAVVGLHGSTRMGPTVDWQLDAVMTIVAIRVFSCFASFPFTWCASVQLVLWVSSLRIIVGALVRFACGFALVARPLQWQSRGKGLAVDPALGLLGADPAVWFELSLKTALVATVGSNLWRTRALFTFCFPCLSPALWLLDGPVWRWLRGPTPLVAGFWDEVRCMLHRMDDLGAVWLHGPASLSVHDLFCKVPYLGQIQQLLFRTGCRRRHLDAMAISAEDFASSLVGKVVSPPTIDGSRLIRQFRSIWKDDKANMANVLKRGPWDFQKYWFALEQADPNRTIHGYSFLHMYIWVRIHNIPLSLMTATLDRVLGASIGKVIMTDTRLEDGNMGEFMRVHVLIDTSKPLHRCVVLSRPDAKASMCPLQYERLPLFCHGCGLIGHSVLASDYSEGGGIEVPIWCMAACPLAEALGCSPPWTAFCRRR
ncbi:hypothetical protein GQ457_15G018500 [Hibiscus cannabinus]